MLPDVLYHVTSRDCVETISRDGIVPRIGENSKSVGGDTPVVYLCMEQDMHRWGLILGKDTVFKISTSSLDESLIHTARYSTAEEIRYFGTVPISGIISCNAMPECPIEVMKDLCLAYIDFISWICVRFAQYEEYHDEQLGDRLAYTTQSVLQVVSRFDWSCLSTMEIHKHLAGLADAGEYTLCDMYKNTVYKLWQHLPLYPVDRLLEQRVNLYMWISENLSKHLNIYTGGWTG